MFGVKIWKIYKGYIKFGSFFFYDPNLKKAGFFRIHLSLSIKELLKKIIILTFRFFQKFSSKFGFEPN